MLSKMFSLILHLNLVDDVASCNMLQWTRFLSAPSRSKNCFQNLCAQHSTFYCDNNICYHPFRSLLNQKALRYEDYTVGELVEGRVESVTPAGISLVLGQNLKGFVPKLHWADDPRLKKPELRFKIGSTLKCRVLRIQLDRRQLHLTCKPSLVDGTENPICSDVGQLEKKLRLKGVVSLIQSGGVLVSFYGNLTGWIPRIRLQQKGIADIGRYFFPGQVISCIVDNVQSDSGKVTLDLDKPTTAAPSAPKKATAAKHRPVSRCENPVGKRRRKRLRN